MSELKIYNNIFENKYESFEYDFSRPLLEQVEEHLDKNTYKENLVECYDTETGETFYGSFIDDDIETPSVLLFANDRNVSAEYIPAENEVISVVFLPASEIGEVIGEIVRGVIIGAAIGVLAAGLIIAGGLLMGASLGGWAVATLIGLGVGGAVVGGILGYKHYKDKYSSTETGAKEGENLPDVRGSENTSLLNANYPCVIGKHLVTPRVVGDPYTEYSGTKGENAYVRILYCVGYAPLKLTDFRLGDFMLAYNRDHAISGGTIYSPTWISGLLKGYSVQPTLPDSGDILDYWKYNDIELEILQQAPNTEVNYGTVYNSVKREQEINANVLYVADKQLDEQAAVTYKGASFPNKFRTNGVWFTDSCPMQFTINIDFQSGLYGTYTKIDKTSTEVKYTKIPLWICAQWRIYNINNESSQPTGRDYSTWNNINFGYTATFTDDLATADKSAHLGNDFTGVTNAALYQDFIGKSLQNFQQLGGEDSVSEIRLSATVTLTKAQCKLILADTNPMNSIEVRILRVSPNYMNEQSSPDPDNRTAYSYSDFFKVTTMVTQVFDKQELLDNDTLVALKPQKEEDMRKFCYVAIKAKADASGYLINQVKKLNCIAESFSPIWDETTNSVLPAGVHKVTNYYGYFNGQQKTNRGQGEEVLLVDGVKTAKEQYEEARHEGYNWLEEKAGSNFTDLMNAIVFSESRTHNDRPAYQLPQAAEQYNNNIVSSGFLLGCVGGHNGPTALGYEDINILSIQDWHEKTKALIDGTTFNSDTVYNGVSYNQGDLVPLRMEANAYVCGGIKKDDMLQKLAFCGRAAWTIDDAGKIRVVMDAPVDYTKGAVNAQNCISSSNTYSYERMPAGLYLSFPDENDGYEQNQFYCWTDGNSLKNYHGQVEPYSIDFVTNNYQAWSLGRYLLACRVQSKETLTRKIGPEGVTYALGDVVLVQGDELLIGEGSGRVEELIESNGIIYGFVMNSTFDYTGELSLDGNSVQGVTIIQPGYMGKNNSITLPLSAPRTQRIIETVQTETGPVSITHDYTLQVGRTNVILFGKVGGSQDYGIPRDTSEDPSVKDTPKYNFKTGDMCMFGLIEKISAPYRITKIKPESGGCFSETLVPYDESLYMAGKVLPAFQNYVSPPPVEQPPITLSEVPVTLQEQNNNLNNVFNSIGFLKDNTPPVAPTNVHPTVTRDYINITWTIGDAQFVKETIVEMSRQNGASGSWVEIARIGSNNTKYYFDRSPSVDGYPEATNIQGRPFLGNYKFRLKNVSIYGIESENWSNSVGIDFAASRYGTWLIPETINVQNEVIDRTAILTALYEQPQDSGGNPIELYGTVKTRVWISRKGNTDEINNETFNDYLDITPDTDPVTGNDIWVTPEFNKDPMPSNTMNTEWNYCHIENGSQTTNALISNTYKITQTLPLIGQTKRLFDSSGEFIDHFNFEAANVVDIPDVTTEPESPMVGDYIHYIGTTSTLEEGKYYVYTNENEWAELPLGYLIHYTGTTTSDYEKDKYYRLSEKEVSSETVEYFEELVVKMIIVPTVYKYKIQMFVEESQSESNVFETTVKALCTNISDIVHSHEHYKNLYVEKLSAINANIGMISQGGMGTFDRNNGNYWALSNLTADDSGVPGGVWQGEFRVGGADQYFKVSVDPSDHSKYNIELKAGNISLTSSTEGDESGMTFRAGTYIYDSSDNSKRLWLTPTGMIAQKYQNTAPSGSTPVMEWVNVAQVQADGNGNIIISNSDNTPTLGFQDADGTIYHFDDPGNLDAEEVITGTPLNPMGIVVTGCTAKQNDEYALLNVTSSKYSAEGTVSQDISQFTDRVVFFSKAEKILLGNDHTIATDGSVEAEDVPSPLTGYNAAMTETSLVDPNVTVGEYIGLTQEQIQRGIFY